MVLFIGYFVFKCYDFIPLKKKKHIKGQVIKLQGNYRC